MSLPNIRVSDLPLQAVLSRLANPTTGFNPLFIQQSAAYGLPATYPFVVDFTGATTFNFFLGQLDSDQLDQTGIVKYPCACLYVLESAETNQQKFTTFSGMVRVVFDVFLSWKSIKGIFNFEQYSQCVESVVYTIINGLPNQDWGKPLTYNGMIQCRRGPLSFDSENWRQKVGFSMLFQVDVSE